MKRYPKEIRKKILLAVTNKLPDDNLLLSEEELKKVMNAFGTTNSLTGFPRTNPEKNINRRKI